MNKKIYKRGTMTIEIIGGDDLGDYTVGDKITFGSIEDLNSEVNKRLSDRTDNVCSACERIRPETSSGLSDCCDSYFITAPKGRYISPLDH